MSPTITPTFDRRADGSLLAVFAAHADAFAASYAAETYLAARGFSVGRRQAGAPRGILLGSYDIQKWRNLRAIERFALHGEMTGEGRHGPIEVRLYADAPEDARQALLGLPQARPIGLARLSVTLSAIFGGTEATAVLAVMAVVGAVILFAANMELKARSDAKITTRAETFAFGVPLVPGVVARRDRP